MKTNDNISCYSYDELEEYLDKWGYGKDVDDVGEFLISQGAWFSDEGIDDGGDNDGEYIMYRLYGIGEHDIKLYYSNLDNIVSYICYRQAVA